MMKTTTTNKRTVAQQAWNTQQRIEGCIRAGILAEDMDASEEYAIWDATSPEVKQAIADRVGVRCDARVVMDALTDRIVS